MDKEEKMEKIFEELPWLGKQFEIKREILKHLIMAEREYAKALQKIGWVESLD